MVREVLKSPSPSRDDPERPCLYCEKFEFPKTKEHVLQRAFGANLTLSRDVCKDCNTRVFAPLDKALTDLLRNFVVGTPMARTLGFLQAQPQLHFDTESGLWLSMRVESNGTPAFYPQLVESSRERMRFIFSGSTLGEAEAMLGRFQSELRDPNTRFVVKLGHAPDRTLPAPQRALVRSSPGVYFVRACSREEADELVRAVKDARFLDKLANDANFELDAESVRFKKTEQPQAHGQLHMDFGKIERALLKTALNAVCVLDPDAARHIAFAKARRYVMQGPRDGTCEFVHHEWMAVGPAVTADIAREGVHTLMLQHLHDEAGPSVSLALFGRPIAMVLLMGKPNGEQIESPIQLGTFVVWEFDPSDKSHEVWTSTTDYLRRRTTE